MTERSRSATGPGRPAADSEPRPAHLGAVLTSYHSYLVTERGLGELTVAGYLKTAERFLELWCHGSGGVGSLDASDVTGFVLAERDRGLSPRTVNEVVVRLRAFLRFAYLKGLTAAPLAGATPWMAGSRAGSIPRGLDPTVPPRLIASCDPSTLVGARDRAILCVLVRLALRVGEVAGLSLCDVDWHHGELAVQGKGGCVERLPLPVDVGEALAAYLVARGPSPCRRLFTTVEEPSRPMTMTAVRAVVRRACERAGVPDCGTHRFRHSVAAELLASGASLPEVGQLLRHHHLQTTAIYATVDRLALRPLAQPWPGATR